ncbi:hypothetical protein [Bacillus inaquosorum]|uniref:hypothetical protein n=1 Tax=Bacillus inaquosorum TaxID=483913 RepID=UPI00227F4982|nr:hypothetical protein [Bacillus inaquosorum]MCY9014397.1 hypothetical protein [Bacillus inaquosorum]MCY9038859.1 hypothetical protein [Bacillus inaquosorum]MCY9047557.1 hypothetical protein [Bacillus inaquosorum]
MNANDLNKKHNIDHWYKYRPGISQYVKYAQDNAHLIAAGHKIEDVYTQFKLARASIMYLEVNDYGKLIFKKDDVHMKYIRSKFLFDALALYNYCIDLSWQVLYLYHGDSHFGVVQDEKYYLQATKDCDQESLKGRLVLIAKRKEIYDYVMNFFNEPLTKEIREAYNYIKHRGTFHIEGLGLNENVVPIGMDGTQLKMINRRSINIEDWKNKLIQFDISFINYFDDIIATLMPIEYQETTLSIETLFNTTLGLNDWENKNENKQ